MNDVTLRPLTGVDAPLLEAATLGNVNWSGERFTMADVRNNPALVHYTHTSGQRGDFGVVADGDSSPAGVAWALYLPADDPGFGFVDEQTPEISLWVAAPHRGRGLGRRLLSSLIDEAQHRGIAQLSLSVEADNFAKDLYASMGFRAVAGREADGVMLRRL